MNTTNVMTVVQVLELAGKLAEKAIAALKSGATHLSIADLVASHTAGEAANLKTVQADADKKFDHGGEG